MNLTVNRGDLLPALERLQRVVERRNTIPILANVRLAALGDGLSVTGTDLDMEASTQVAADITAPGETTAPLATLRDFVRKCEGEAMSLVDSNGRLTVKCGRARAALASLPAADFPSLATGDFPTVFDLRADTVAEMIERAAFAISTEETRYYLNGIYLHVAVTDGAATLRAVATDGHRLALCEVPLPAGAAGMPGIILPRKAVSEISTLAKAMKESTLRIEVSATKLRVTAGATVLATKLIDGTFPDYTRVIPRSHDKTARVHKPALSAAVDRVAAVSTERGRAVKFSFGPTQGGAGLMLTAENPDMGSATDEVEADYSGEPLDIGFNSRYMLDILAAFPDGTVQMALQDAGSPCLISTGAPSPLFVLMPMRV